LALAWLRLGLGRQAAPGDTDLDAADDRYGRPGAVTPGAADPLDAQALTAENHLADGLGTETTRRRSAPPP
jgi:hypothetical protein